MAHWPIERRLGNATKRLVSNRNSYSRYLCALSIFAIRHWAAQCKPPIWPLRIHKQNRTIAAQNNPICRGYEIGSVDVRLIRVKLPTRFSVAQTHTHGQFHYYWLLNELFQSVWSLLLAVVAVLLPLPLPLLVRCCFAFMFCLCVLAASFIIHRSR